MTLRVIGVLGCVLALLAAAPSVLAQEEVVLACCSNPSECGGSWVCCDWEVVAEQPCSSEEPGFCRAACVRNAEGR